MIGKYIMQLIQIQENLNGISRLYINTTPHKKLWPELIST